MESVVSAPAAPPKKNLVLITSVLYTVNGNHPMSRSIYSHDERFEQTKKTISAARKYIPNSWILFMECSPLREEHAAYIKENVDFFKNLWDTPIRGRMFTASKAMGEGTQTIYALNYLFRENMEFNHYFKISGRYFLDERFNYSKWDNDLSLIHI